MRRVFYRLRQFHLALGGRPSAAQLALAEKNLAPSLHQLFLTLQPSEQAHACQVCATVIAAGHDASELLQAALLHDIGKACYPLRLWERVFIVLTQAVLPRRAARWGQDEPRGWRRAFVIAAQHPEWGAQMAEGAGASAAVVDLIARHAEKDAGEGLDTEVEKWLEILRAADGAN